MRPAIILPAEVSWKRNKMTDFYCRLRISLCGVVVRCSRIKSEVLGSSPTELFIPIFFFFSVSLCCCFL